MDYNASVTQVQPPALPIALSRLWIFAALILGRTFTAALSQPAAIVVGGGPAGLATALMLAKHHGYSVTLIESAGSKQQHLEFDPSRAYLYNINGRGQRLSRRFPELQAKLESKGVGITKFERITVPADPKEIFDPHQPWSRGMSQDVLDKMGILYWIPRYLMLDIMMGEVEKEGKITVCFGHDCQKVLPEGDDVLRVDSRVQSRNGLVVSHYANLVVGADGPRSLVRQELETQHVAFKGWKNYSGKVFRIHKWSSPSVGLRLKTLQFEPNLQIPVGDGRMISTESIYTYNFQSINKRGDNAISLTLLPIQDANAKRPVAVATPPGHELWKQTTGSEMKAWMSKAFPRFSFNDTDNTLVTDEEWERFARSEGSRFPYCQYCRGLSTFSPSGRSGVALVGDVIHAFPPDMGQGVNMALGDVAVLDDCLGNAVSLGEALQDYQDQREGETKAVVRMCRFAAPFQYGQPSLAMRVRKKLWFLNVAMRMALNKLSRGFLPNPGIVAMMDPNLKFERIMRRADTLTCVLWAAVATALVKVFVR